MHPLIRFAAALIFLFLAALSVLAGPKYSRPIGAGLIHPRQIEKLNHLLMDSGTQLNIEKKSGSMTAKSTLSEVRICSCQVLNLVSSNYDHRYMVLLAERTNDGDGAGFKAARNRIQKEKKQLKRLFYDKVKLVAEMKATGTCKSMYFRLRTADSQLQLYEILNAD
ncbi:MAG TPA: hypothetical protein VII28_06160 [Puia sp.]